VRKEANLRRTSCRMENGMMSVPPQGDRTSYAPFQGQGNPCRTRQQGTNDTSRTSPRPKGCRVLGKGPASLPVGYAYFIRPRRMHRPPSVRQRPNPRQPEFESATKMFRPHRIVRAAALLSRENGAEFKYSQMVCLLVSVFLLAWFPTPTIMSRSGHFWPSLRRNINIPEHR
jgi:hypothetical protein